MSIKVFRRFSENFIKNPAAVAIGTFDGLHLGHQKVLESAAKAAHKYHYAPVLLTFEPYPQAFFHPERSKARLTSLREKIMILQRLAQQDVFSGEWHVIALPFDENLSKLSPEQFIQEILIKTLKTKYIAVGEDFHYGHAREGDVNFLQQYVETHIIPPVMFEEERISSTRIRHLLANGELSLASALLGRHYSVTGRVVQGQQRGRMLGFPTANIALNKRIPPVHGVFAVRVNGQYSGVANLGMRPTVDGLNRFLEVYIFNFDENIYGQYLEIAFIHKIRDEKRFESLDALKAQIAEDVKEARNRLQ